MNQFAFRNLEFHSSRMWQWAQVEEALDFMAAQGLNGLIFHQNDLIDQLVVPTRYFSDELMLKRWPVRLHTIENNRQYINKVVRAAAARKIAFFLQVKELWFPDGLMEFFPHLRNADGSLCPNNPFWWEFLEEKMNELLAVLPGLAGVVVSAGTRESKVSISTNTCMCEVCHTTTPVDWYARLLETMFKPLDAHGKLLAVRDFSYSAAQQGHMIRAAAECSDRIVISLKNTPHDYYPTFPDNPAIGRVGGLRQWIEFDTWGQFYGLGFFPASVAEDMQQRMLHCRAEGAVGISLRTDWEVITEGSSFNSLNMLNVFAGAAISSNLDAGLDDVCRSWAARGLRSALKSGSRLCRPSVPANARAFEKLRAFMRASWSVIEKTVFIRGHVFNEDCMFPDTVAKGFDEMVKIHGMDDWKPGASALVAVNAENIALILAEKEAAVREAAALPGILEMDRLGLEAELAAELREMLDLYGYYVEGFSHCARVCYLTRLAAQTPGEGEMGQADAAICGLADFSKRLAARLVGTEYPHYVYWLLDHLRLESLAMDAAGSMRAARGNEPL